MQRKHKRILALVAHNFALLGFLGLAIWGGLSGTDWALMTGVILLIFLIVLSGFAGGGQDGWSAGLDY